MNRILKELYWITSAIISGFSIVLLACHVSPSGLFFLTFVMFAMATPMLLSWAEAERKYSSGEKMEGDIVRSRTDHLITRSTYVASDDGITFRRTKRSPR